ncbi:hypothetical protein OXX59_004896 [Metschnikowia pulcherrima]
MLANADFVTASLSFVARADMPTLNTGTSTTSTSSSSSSSSSRGSSSSSSGSTSRASSSSSGSTGMPTISTSSSSSSSAGFTTPSIGVPSKNGNPYISRTSQPSGTVFIAVGSVVAVILLGFALYHLIKSLTASSLAKKTVANEKFAYQKFVHNNNVAYGGSSSTLFNTEYKGSVSKLPLANGSQYFGNDFSNPALSETERATSRHDLTSMFISPVKEMSNNRASSHALNNSTTNLSVYGRSGADTVDASNANRPNYYMNESINNSEYNLSPETQNARNGERKPRNPIPSMYLEDLIDS